MCLWIRDCLTNPTVRDRPSPTLSLNTDKPHGCLLSLALFTLVTNACIAIQSWNTVLNFLDNINVVGLITNNNETACREKVQHFFQWCLLNNLRLNKVSTKTVLPQETEEGWTVTSVVEELLQSHDREHPLPQYNCVAWQMEHPRWWKLLSELWGNSWIKYTWQRRPIVLFLMPLVWDTNYLYRYCLENGIGTQRPPTPTLFHFPPCTHTHED